jgi:hypothetical protein
VEEFERSRTEERLRALQESLDRMCSRTRIEISAGVVRVPSNPIVLRPLLLKALTQPGESEWEVEERLDAVGDWGLLHGHLGGPLPRTIVGFQGERSDLPWDILGLNFKTSVTFVCKGMDPEGSDPVVYAVIDPEGKPALWDALYQDLMRNNGHGYGILVWPRPPLIIDNRKGRVSDEAIREGCYLWMESESQSYRWLDLLDQTLPDLKDADVRGALQKIAEEAIRITDAHPGDDTDAIHEASRRLTEENKLAILDAYLRLSYHRKGPDKEVTDPD